jgi:hypothetical protein
MPLNPFAALEARVNRAVESHLSNAIATYHGGEHFGVIFERGQTELFGGAGGIVDAPECAVSFNVTVHAPGLAEGGLLVIDGVDYTVGAGVQPDASGWISGLAVFKAG